MEEGATCDTCQRLAKEPTRFRVSLPEDIVFNRTVLVDLMWLESEPSHVVDKTPALTRQHFA